MARNKKENKLAKISNTQVLEPNVFIKVVKDKQTIKSFKLHNEATSLLLYGTLLNLIDAKNSDLLPNFIGIGTDSTPNSTIGGSGIFSAVKLGAESTIIRSIVEKGYKGAPIIDTDNKVVTVKYQGIIQGDNNSGSDIYEIGLFGTKIGDSLLARVVTPKISLNKGESLVIDWTFSIKNIQSV